MDMHRVFCADGRKLLKGDESDERDEVHKSDESDKECVANRRAGSAGVLVLRLEPDSPVIDWNPNTDV